MTNEEEVKAAAEYVSPVSCGTRENVRYGGIVLRDNQDGKDVWDVLHELHQAHKVLADTYLEERLRMAELSLPVTEDWLREIGLEPPRSVFNGESFAIYVDAQKKWLTVHNKTRGDVLDLLRILGVQDE